MISFCLVGEEAGDLSARPCRLARESVKRPSRFDRLLTLSQAGMLRARHRVPPGLGRQTG